MKSFFLLLLSGCLFSIGLNAQSQQGSSWKVKSIGLSLSSTLEMPMNMNSGTFFGMKGEEVPQVINQNFGSAELVSMTCDNGELRASISLQPPGSDDTEVQFTLVNIIDRMDKMVFEAEDAGEDNFLTMESLSDEVAFEIGLIKSHKVTNWFRLYAGGSLNSGISYNHRLCIEGQIPMSDISAEGTEQLNFSDNPTQQESYFQSCNTVSNGLNQRLFLQGGMGILFFKRVETGLTYRKGIGYRSNFDGEFYGVTQQSLNISIRWMIP
ncbi:MAG: hypothetical protein AAFV95_21745 [Bacteroidota bacterium]